MCGPCASCVVRESIYAYCHMSPTCLVSRPPPEAMGDSGVMSVAGRDLGLTPRRRHWASVGPAVEALKWLEPANDTNFVWVCAQTVALSLCARAVSRARIEKVAHRPRHGLSLGLDILRLHFILPIDIASRSRTSVVTHGLVYPIQASELSTLASLA